MQGQVDAHSPNGTGNLPNVMGMFTEMNNL